MPATSRAQQQLMAIAEHHPEQVRKRNRGVLKMTKGQLHDFAATKGLQEGGRVWDMGSGNWAQPTLKDPQKYWVQDKGRNWSVVDPEDPRHEDRFLHEGSAEDIERTRSSIKNMLNSNQKLSRGGLVHAGHPYALGYRRVK